MSVPLDADFPAQLLTWYDGHYRQLPWRETSDPYRIWLSEVMLQQTQVETVIPYYHRWLARFPSIAHVAQASDTEVLKLWEGLGYYRRALQFHQACQQIHNQLGGQLPADPSDFRRLPGVGPYTFAAVRSIGFGDRLPAVDGNVKRVVARVLKCSETGQTLVMAVEQALGPVMPGERPGDFNQAIMDLGGRVCTSRSPKCDICPIAHWCRSRPKIAKGVKRVAERRAGYKPQPKFEGSRRYHRGRIVQALRELSEGRSLLAKRLGSKLGIENITGLLDALARDGLIRQLASGRVRLP